MQFLKDHGFILRRINFGDSDRYITIFTKNHGKIEVVAKGIRKITSRRAAACELLNLVEFQSVRTAKNFILTEVRLIDSFEHLKRELAHIKKVFLMCELLDAVMPAGVRHPDVFDLIERASRKMNESEKNMAYFQAKLLSLLGFWDGRASFKNEAHVKNFIEQIIERKLKTPQAFG
jgi:DNA repair protein RecO (recombination protein O)